MASNKFDFKYFFNFIILFLNRFYFIFFNIFLKNKIYFSKLIYNLRNSTRQYNFN